MIIITLCREQQEHIPASGIVGDREFFLHESIQWLPRRDPRQPGPGPDIRAVLQPSKEATWQAPPLPRICESPPSIQVYNVNHSLITKLWKKPLIHLFQPGWSLWCVGKGFKDQPGPACWKIFKRLSCYVFVNPCQPSPLMKMY